ncbi:hypothetical protein RYX36_025048 [Vicia faba]
MLLQRNIVFKFKKLQRKASFKEAWIMLLQRSISFSIRKLQSKPNFKETSYKFLQVALILVQKVAEQRKLQRSFSFQLSHCLLSLSNPKLYLHLDIAQYPKRFKIVLQPKEQNISIVIDHNEEIIHKFKHFDFKWRLIIQAILPTYVKRPGSSNEHHTMVKSSIHRFEVRFHKKPRNMTLSEYFLFVMKRAKETQEERKTLKLFTLTNDRVLKRFKNMWQYVALDPSCYICDISDK